MNFPASCFQMDRFTIHSQRAQKSLLIWSGMVAILLLCVPLRSQINTGRISGVITDQSGGAIAGAKVTVTEVATNVSRSLTTDSAGGYAAPNLLPGTYTVHVEFAGFANFDRQNVEVGAGGDIRVDVALRPGQQSQTVTVTESIPLVNTTNAQTGGTLETSVIESIPLNGRNYRWLVEYVPGVMTQPGEGIGSSMTNGGGTDWVNFMVNGLYDESPYSKQSTVGGAGEAGDTTLLPLDAIQEMALVTNPKAEYGLDPGLTENIALKSGTNNLHGSAYAFGRDQALDARNPFALLGKQPVSFQQWGATLGGPIKKDKIFYFVGYESERLKVTSDYQITGDATTAAGLGTTFSVPDAIAAMNTAGQPLSPLSLNVAGCNSANPNIGSKVGSTVALACTANQFGQPGLFNNSTPSDSVPFDLPQYGGSDNGLGKIDYHLNEHHTINGSYFFGQYHEYADASTTITEPYWDEVLGVRSQLARAVEVWTPNSTWLNEVRVGWDHDSRPVASAECSVNGSVADPLGLSSPAGQFGGPNYSSQYGLVSGANACGIPTIKFASGITSVFGFGNNRADVEGSYQFADNVSYTRGKHQFKFGVDARFLNFTGTKVQDSQRGTITFGSPGLAAFAGATALESFLAGDPSAETIKVGNPIRTIHWDEPAFFAQDDWRVLPRVTLNLGLRWEIETPAHDTGGQLGNFSPTQPSGMIQGNSLWPTQSDPEPHVGLAWDMMGTGRTTLRTGIGVATATPQLQNWITSQFDDMSAVPTGATLYYANGTSIKGPGTINNILETLAPFSSNGSFITGNNLPWTSGSPLFNTSFFGCGNGQPVTGSTTVFNPQPCTGYAADPNVKFPEMATWNLNVQHAFTNNLSLDLGYIGSHAWDITGIADLNEPTPGPAGSSEQTRRPYYNEFPWFAQVLSIVDAGSSNYAALQAYLNQRVSRGLSYSIGYTLSHAVGEQGGVGTGNGMLLNAACPRCEYGDLTFDVRHHFSLTGTYNLPGRKAPGQMLQGWAVNSSVNILSALPLNALDSSRDTSGTGEKIDRWTLYGSKGPFDQILGGPGTIPCYTLSSGKFASAANCTVVPNAASFPTPCIAAATAEPNGPSGATDTGLASLSSIGCYAMGSSAIVPPAQGTFGNMGRDELRAKGFDGWNASITKDWKFKERLTAQFRWEAFNLLNRTQYAGIGANLGNPASFGEATQTPDVFKSNPVVGSGGPREMQVGLKLIF